MGATRKVCLMIIAYIEVTWLFNIFIFLINLSSLTVDIVVSFYIQLNHQPRERFLTKSFQVYFPLILVTRTWIKRTVCSSLSFIIWKCSWWTSIVVTCHYLLFKPNSWVFDIILGSFILAMIQFCIARRHPQLLLIINKNQ